MLAKIDNNVPMPPGQARKYPWDELKVGQSFAIIGKSNGHQLCLQAMRIRKGKKFECRTVAGVSRVWRTK